MPPICMGDIGEEVGYVFGEFFWRLSMAGAFIVNLQKYIWKKEECYPYQLIFKTNTKTYQGERQAI